MDAASCERLENGIGRIGRAFFFCVLQLTGKSLPEEPAGRLTAHAHECYTPAESMVVIGVIGRER